MDTSSIVNKYDAHELLYSDLKQAIDKAKTKVHFPISNEVLGDLVRNTTYILLSIFDAAGKDNLYTAFILYRSLLEHFYKSMYIVDRMIATGSDDTAEKYKIHYFVSELLAEQAGVLEMEDLLNDSKVKTDFIQFLTTKIPGIEGFDKSNQREISEAVKQFNLKEIIKQLHNNYKKEDSLAATNYVVAQTIPEYSHVCTFTHGGPYASMLMDKIIGSNDVENQLMKILQIGLTSTCVIKENWFMTFEINASFKKYVFELQSIRAFV